MTTIRLSLGIPVYNQADTIAETIRSVLSQTVAFDEIVIADNHSTDGTSEILKEFSGKIRVVSPAAHIGMAENWNFCIEQLNGEWFSLLSGDDLLMPEFVKEVKEAINNNLKSVLIRTDWEVINGSGQVIRVHNQLSVSKITLPPATWIEQLNGPKTSFAAFAARREVWQSVGGFPTDFHLFQDWIFWLKLAPLGAFIRIPLVLAQYRSHERKELELKRLALRIEDEYHYLLDILPGLPWTKQDSSSIIKSIRRQRLIAVLNYLVNQPQIFNNEQCVIQLKAIAAVAEFSHFDKWLLNPLPIKHSLFFRISNGIKSFIRPILSKLKTSN